MTRKQHQQLETLLRETGEHLGHQAEVQPGLATRVESLGRRRDRRRRVVRAGTGLAAAASLLVACLLLAFRANDPAGQMAENDTPTETATLDTPDAPTIAPSGPAVEGSSEDIEALRSELALLKEELRILRGTVKRLRTEDRFRRELAALRRKRLRSALKIAPESQIERAASVLLARAEYEQTHPDAGHDPAAAYRRAIEYFPETTSAETARRRLAELANNQKSTPPDKQGDPR